MLVMGWERNIDVPTDFFVLHQPLQALVNFRVASARPFSMKLHRAFSILTRSFKLLSISLCCWKGDLLVDKSCFPRSSSTSGWIFSALIVWPSRFASRPHESTNLL